MRNPFRFYGAFCLLLLAASSSVSSAQNLNADAPIVISASQPIQPIGPADFHVRFATSPQGNIIGMNARYLTLNKKPWLPVMGEFQYARVPQSQWNNEILKMKAAGVQIISTYVFWIHQEEVKGQFDWSGRRNLRRFVQLCAKHGVYVWLRIGPWDHGEARNGGFPDWLVKEVPKQDLRRDDPLFMRYVRQLYQQIGKQVQGLTWNQGGPIIGVQLENEYSMRGPKAGDAYILALKRLALASGLHVPIYSVTGWDDAIVPRGHVVALFGGYPDAPWDGTLHRLPPQEVYEFRFGSRVSGNMGAMGKHSAAGNKPQYNFPFMTTEMGGGIQDTYARRPVIMPNDVAAMMPVMLGSGVNLYGTYVFQGGINPNGKLTTLQESQRTGYPNSLPVKSYDFQAPLSTFGEERVVYRKLKIFNYFLNEFGSQLAPMPVFAPAKLPKGPQDFSVARVAVRTNGKSGFLFFNNYVRYHHMPDRLHFQVKVELPGRVLMIPNRPVNLPSGDFGIWPFGLQLGGLHLRYATAQLFCRTISGKNTRYYFVATKGVPTEFAFAQKGASAIKTRGQQSQRDGITYIHNLLPSFIPAITASNKSGDTTQIVLLSEKEAEDAWRLPSNHEYLLFTHDQYFAQGNTLTLERDNDPHFSFAIAPPLFIKPSATEPLKAVNEDNDTSSYRASMQALEPAMTIRQIRNARTVPPVKLGKLFSWRKHRAAMAPTTREFALAAQWKIGIPQKDWNGVSNLFLAVNYDADAARLYSGGDLLDDDFYNGKVWRVGLKRFRSQIEQNGLTLDILPRRADAPIFLERRFRSPRVKSGQILQLRDIHLIPQYRLRLELPSY